MPSIISRIVSGVNNLFLRQVMYLDKQSYQLSSRDGFTTTTTISRKILVVSRHNYTEQVQWLPVSRRAEAKKLVKFQQVTRSPGSFYILGQPLNGKTPVIWYQLKPQVLTHNALLYLPETVLLGLPSQIGDVWVYQSPDHNNDIFVSHTYAGVVSAIKGGVLHSAQQFMLAQGSTMQQCHHLNAKQLSGRLLSTLFSLYRYPLAGLVNKGAFRHNSASQSFSRYIVPLSAAMTLYLLMASYWAEHLQQKSREQLQQANREANQIHLQRERITNMISRYEQLQQLLPESDNLLQLWQVLAPLYQQDVIVTNVQHRQQQVRLRIEAPSATAALQLLVQQPGVMNARLEGNVRRQSNKDIATVSFQLQQESL